MYCEVIVYGRRQAEITNKAYASWIKSGGLLSLIFSPNTLYYNRQSYIFYDETEDRILHMDKYITEIIEDVLFHVGALTKL